MAHFFDQSHVFTILLLQHMFCVRQVTIFCEEQHQYFEGIWEVVHEKEKLEWTLHGALRTTTAHWNGPWEFSTDVYSQTHPARYILIHHTMTSPRHVSFNCQQFLYNLDDRVVKVIFIFFSNCALPSFSVFGSHVVRWNALSFAYPCNRLYPPFLYRRAAWL